MVCVSVRPGVVHEAGTADGETAPCSAVVVPTTGAAAAGGFTVAGTAAVFPEVSAFASGDAGPASTFGASCALVSAGRTLTDPRIPGWMRQK
jgi:hypothetical protein